MYLLFFHEEQILEVSAFTQEELIFLLLFAEDLVSSPAFILIVFDLLFEGLPVLALLFDCFFQELDFQLNLFCLCMGYCDLMNAYPTSIRIRST